MAEDTGTCRLPLASLADGALALLLSFVAVPDIVVANTVSRAWVMDGNRTDLWASLGKHFEVTMPVTLGPQVGARVGGASRQKRTLRSGTNARRTFLKSWAAAVNADRIKHDSTLSEAYTLFRMQDSVVRLKTLLRRKWGITFQPHSKSACGGGGSSVNSNRKMPSPASPAPSASACAAGAAGGRDSEGTAGAGQFLTGDAANAITISSSGGVGSDTSSRWGAWHQRGRWTFNVNHRHGIFEGNTMLNFAVRCGRKKCVEFILRRMGADTEIADYGGFTPLLNTAWRGDLPLLKQLLAAGARLDVEGVSRGVGPYDALGWAERKNRPVTAAFLRRLAADKTEVNGVGGGEEARTKMKTMTVEKRSSQTDVRVGAP